MKFIKNKIGSFLSDCCGAPVHLAKQRILCALNMATNENTKRIKGFKNRHQGKRAFVVGNGPSLQMADLERLTREITFACNKIFLAFPKVSWRPTYHFIEDEKGIAAASTHISSFHHQMFLGMDAIRLGITNSNAVYYWRDFQLNPHDPGFQKRPLGHVYMGYSTLYTCLQFALYMGIKEVYLLGVDFDYVKPKNIVNPNSLGTPIYKAAEERNNFTPDYYAPGEEMYDPNLPYQKAAFQKAREVYQAEGRIIKNATRGGKLEVFDRVDFDSLF